MISIVWQGDHRYNIYRSDEDIGCITVSDNQYHNTHRYLNLGLEQYDPAIAKELFSLLRKELGKPLQIMLCATPEMHNFLTSGGFERKRRCYELEVASSESLRSYFCYACRYSYIFQCRTSHDREFNRL